MNRILMFSLALAVLLFSGTAQAVTASTYDAFAFNDNRHAVWIPGLDQRHLLFDDGATLTVEDEAWNLEGTLTSRDGSTWALSVDFTGVLSGNEFRTQTSADDGALKGTNWNQQAPDWTFAENVAGKLVALSGENAGREFSIEREGGASGFLAQFGTCLNDKNCGQGLSSWIQFEDVNSGERFRGDININVSAAVPEPSAALIFGLGAVLASSSIRRGDR